MAIRQERTSYRIEDLIADEVTKKEALTYIANCEGLFEDDIQNILHYLSILFEIDTNENDHTWFVLFSCTSVFRQILLGVQMLAQHGPKGETALPYWFAIYELSEGIPGDRNLARLTAFTNIMMICGQPTTTEAQNKIIDDLRAEHAAYVKSIARKKGIIDNYIIGEKRHAAQAKTSL